MKQNSAYQRAEQKIREAARAGAKKLSLTGEILTEIPESLCQLTQLKTLSLAGNQLTKLPEWLCQLTQLKTLSLDHNQLSAFPEWLCQLTQLNALSLAFNQLSAFPERLCQLTQLQYLGLAGNQLSALPECLCQLTQLKILDLDGNQLAKLPECLCQLTQLILLDLSANQLTTLPFRLTGIKDLAVILDKNPLNPALAAAYKQGWPGVQRYLLELERGARRRYEAKLFILGDGNEGKTCVSRALRGLPFREQQTTHGVDVVQWKFPHPDDPTDHDKEITLNVWDFEGQEISHQTHQFFLSSQSMYLLVFKCRDQFLIDRAEYWLDTIRARAPKARVAIVISECEGRSPLLPLDRIQAQYGDLLAKEWFFPVGCEDGSNIPKLKGFLQRWAADLEFMGAPWPVSYGVAEVKLKEKAKMGKAQIDRNGLYKIFEQAGLNPDGYEDAARAMSRLGVITHFPDCPDLRDFVVFRPQWLTKAISKVMEDKKLTDDQGEIASKRMQEMWMPYTGMFTTFHCCMKEFELCYDLEHDRSLVPLRFGYLRPAIPWSDTPGLKRRRVEYKLNIRPPMGIMSRFIVKTHHMIRSTLEQPKGVYWHNGVFLRSGEGLLCSEALCEFVPDERKFCIEVRAAYPQNFCEQIHGYIKSVFSFFDGLEAERSYGCIKVDLATGHETSCSGVYTEKRIYTAISKGRPIIDCDTENHEVDPRILVGGFGSFNEFVMARVVPIDQLIQVLDRQPEWAAPFLGGIQGLLGWVEANGRSLDQLLKGQSDLRAEFRQEAELKLHEYLTFTSRMLDDRDFTAAPGLISIGTKDRTKWNPAAYFKKTYVLTPYCECKGKIHPCKDAAVEFTRDQVWWEKTAPWVARGTKLLSSGLGLAFAGMPLAVGGDLFDVVKDDVELMTKLAEHLEVEGGSAQARTTAEEVAEAELGKGIREGDSESRLTRAALARLLEELAPDNYRARKWGSLERVRMSDDSYRWLCADCRAPKVESGLRL